MAGGALALNRIRLPLAFSVTGHAVLLALLILFAAEIPPPPTPSAPGGIEDVASLRVAPLTAKTVYSLNDVLAI
jgi:hypothetical protein